MDIWSIEGEEVIVLGDTTTHGGKVITAAPNLFYRGIPVACVGDEVTCPKCNGTHAIASGAPAAFGNGKNIARNNDMVSCGARLVSGTGVLAENSSHFAAKPEEDAFDECFQFICEDTGEPIVDLLYVILLNGEVLLSGRTDYEGQTVRACTEQREIIDVFSGADAVEILRRVGQCPV